MTYKSSLHGEEIAYEIRNGSLHASTAGLKITVDLSGGSVVQKDGKLYSPWFRMGASVLVVSVFTFVVIAFKEGRIRIGDLGPSGYLHLGFILVGLGLVIAFRRPLIYKEVIQGTEGIAIWKNPNDEGGFERFSQQVEEEIRWGAQKVGGFDDDETLF